MGKNLRILDKEIVMENDYILVRIKKRGNNYSHQEFYVKDGGKLKMFFSSESLLQVKTNTYQDLNCNSYSILEDNTKRSKIRFLGKTKDWVYSITFILRNDGKYIEGSIEFRTYRPQEGWFYYYLHPKKFNTEHIYPWLNGGINVQPGRQVQRRMPTTILKDGNKKWKATYFEQYVTSKTWRDHTLDNYKHIWANLAGVPLIISRDISEGYIGGLGFPISYNYMNSSMAYEDEKEPHTIYIGWGIAEGPNAADGLNKYLPKNVYFFPFQVFVLKGDFKELCEEWVIANNWNFNTPIRRTINGSLEMCISCFKNFPYATGKGYHTLAPPPTPLKGDYYMNFGRAIHLVDNPWAAYICYKLYVKSKEEFWRKRAFEQLDFVVESQHSNGGMFFYYDTLRNEYISYQSHNYMIDKLALCAEYMLKTYTEVKNNEGQAKEEWKTSAVRMMDFILSQQEDDGSFPHHVEFGSLSKSIKIPAGEVLRALNTFYLLIGEEKYEKARKLHEEYIIKNHFSRQYWNGRNPDLPPYTINHSAANDFIQYCIQRFEIVGERKYLEWARTTAYWLFFAHVPKQLEWLNAPTKGAIQEQSGWMTYNIDLYDNLIITPLQKLAIYLDDPFLAQRAKQAIQLQMVTQEDDPSKDSYGVIHQCIVDSIGELIDPTGGARSPIIGFGGPGEQYPTGIAFFPHQVPATVEDLWNISVCFGTSKWAVNLDAEDPTLSELTTTSPCLRFASTAISKIKWSEKDKILLLMLDPFNIPQFQKDFCATVDCKNYQPYAVYIDGSELKKKDQKYHKKDNVLVIKCKMIPRESVIVKFSRLK